MENSFISDQMINECFCLITTFASLQNILNLKGASINILRAINFCEDVGIKLFLISLNIDLNFCNSHLLGNLSICKRLSLNAHWCVLAPIKLCKQLHW